MKLKHALIFGLLIMLAGLFAGSAQANGFHVDVPDPDCAGTFTSVPFVTISDAPGACTDFTYTGGPSDFLGIIITQPTSPLSCTVGGTPVPAFDTCKVLVQDFVGNPLEVAILDGLLTVLYAEKLITLADLENLEEGVNNLPNGDGFAVAFCSTGVSTESTNCGGLEPGESGSITTPEPPGWLLLGMGLSLLGLGGWKHRKLVALRPA
ncbi:MAG TPA: hypothetical protein VEG64_11730 [Candidatus Sulfotelmatobacter sp.]|nr:hypothetical protein [Candidatus Sulfotelmatobacter sp.]